MMFCGLILIGILGVSGLGQQTGANSEAAAAPSLSDARELAGRGRLEAALAELEALAKVVPEAVGVERLRGVILYQKEMLPEAEAAFGNAVAQDAADRESMAMRGVTLYRLGRPGEAIPLLERARELGSGKPRSENPDLGHPHPSGNETEHPDLGHPKDSLSHPDGKDNGPVRVGHPDLLSHPESVEPKSENPDMGHPHSLQNGSEHANIGGPDSESEGGRLNVEPSYVLGLCYTDAKRYDDARRAFAEQFGFGADTAEAYLVAARLFLRREFADEAARFANKAVALNPGLPLAHQLLGEIALAKADLPLAVEELEAERKLNPLNGALYDRLGDAYVRNGQFAEARVALNKAVLLEPNMTGPYILLGEALIKLGEPVEAVHYLTRAAGMDPGNSVTHTILGQAYRALGRMADANREYKLAVALQHKGDAKPGGGK